MTDEKRPIRQISGKMEQCQAPGNEICLAPSTSEAKIEVDNAEVDRRYADFS
jgi:hypothetical protein